MLYADHSLISGLYFPRPESAHARIGFRLRAGVRVCGNCREATSGGVSAAGPGTSVPNVLLDRSAGADAMRGAFAATAG